MYTYRLRARFRQRLSYSAVGQLASHTRLEAVSSAGARRAPHLCACRNPLGQVPGGGPL